MAGKSKFDVEKAVSLYKEGKSFREISEAVGSHVSNIRYHMMSAGLHEPNKDKYEWPIEQMRQWYEVDRMTVEEIGAKLQRNSKVVNKVCKRNGFRMRPRGQKFGPEHKGWKGGRIVDKSGYILVYQPDHPHSNKRGYVREHRVVMEKKIGRILEKHEVVHHIDDDKGNNHPDNLHLFSSNGKHLAETLAGKCPNWTPEGRAKLLECCRKPRKRSSSRSQTKRDALQSP